VLERPPVLLLPLDRLEERLEVASRWIGTMTLAEALGASRQCGTKTLAWMISKNIVGRSSTGLVKSCNR
jgi:hypothetical protein